MLPDLGHQCPTIHFHNYHRLCLCTSSYRKFCEVIDVCIWLIVYEKGKGSPIVDTAVGLCSVTLSHILGHEMRWPVLSLIAWYGIRLYVAD